MSDPQFQAVMLLEKLRMGSMHACEIGRQEVVVCHTTEGVFALNNICTHAEARMSEGRLRGTRLVCPLHAAAFDIRDGRPLAGPASQPLPVYAVQVVNGMIEVAVESPTS